MFTLNGKTFETDAETLNVMRNLMPSAKATNDSSAVMAMLFLGLEAGRITEMAA